VTVETAVHPSVDLVAVRAESPLLREGKLAVAIDFPYPAAGDAGSWAGDWNRPTAHASELIPAPGEDRATILRRADASACAVSLVWSAGCALRKGQAEHRFILSAGGAGPLELVCAFSGTALGKLRSVRETRRAAAERWKEFWMSGGAIGLSGSKDPRWRELERRIVLSRYLMAAPSAGSLPPAETGLMGIDFFSNPAIPTHGLQLMTAGDLKRYWRSDHHAELSNGVLSRPAIVIDKP
jgi:hypothetical protein